jgi:RNA-directed DNA polymerase
MQKRIYQASQRGNTRAVHTLQKLLLKSEAARLLAVRRVTQENQGKKTAGVDGVKSVKPQARLVMASHIHPKHWRHQTRHSGAPRLDSQARQSRAAPLRDSADDRAV